MSRILWMRPKWYASRAASNRSASLHFMALHKSREVPDAVLKVVRDFVDQRRQASHDGYLARDAARITGATISGLVEKRRLGIIPTVLACCPNGERIFPLLEKNAIHALAQQRRSRLPLVRAAAQLGIPSYSLIELIHEGAIAAIEAPPGRSTAINVEQQSLDTFEDEIRARACQSPCRNPVSLSEIMATFGRRLKPWAAVLLAVMKGQFAVSIDPSKSGKAQGLAMQLTMERENAYLLSRFQVGQDAMRSVSHVAIGEAGGILNMGYISTMRVLGLTAGNTKMLSVPLSEVLLVAERCISVSEASARMGIVPQSFPKIARSYGVPRIAAAVYCRKSAEALMPELRYQNQQRII